MNTKTYKVTVEEDPETGDLILPIPTELLSQMGWATDDVLNWDFDEEEQSYVLTKKLQPEENKDGSN